MKDWLTEMFGHLNPGDRCTINHRRGKLSRKFVAQYAGQEARVMAVERLDGTTGMGAEKFLIQFEDKFSLFLPRLCLDRVKQRRKR